MPSARPKMPVRDLHQPVFLKFLSLFSILLYVASACFLLIMWPTLPDQIPVHFDATGAVTRLGSVWSLVGLWITGAALFVFMHIMERFPHVHNYPITITWENAQEAYSISRSLIQAIKSVVLMLFALILLNSLMISLGWTDALSAFILPLTLFGTGIPIAVAVVKLVRMG